ncbi:MAG: branched-chain amino acid transport system substrate-binding protein [Solirubrobacteraceae bacterium]|jgi:ABC-type branched-subunit amino acid transport system substrate-binding protein|nr:branched-chain amino acid transport system substrate-binding protein [Solirubrobacteraceae bacterium]
MRRAAFTAVAAIAAAGLIGACGSSGSSSSKAPGVTATSITFGAHEPLTGPAAPGYSEIAPASEAFFKYVNAHGGVFGRKINLLIKDDAYNPTNTVNVVHQLVLQNNVFGIFEGLGTPTHTKVVSYLNASKVPDLFVASGCPCWDNGASQPYTFGWQPNYTIEGKILGQYIKQHFAGQKVAVLYQDDDFGQGGLAGIQAEVPASSIVAKEPYQSGTTTLAPQITAIKASKATVLVDFTVPIYTAIGQLTSFTLGYKPQLVISSVGIDPTTVGGLLKSISKGKASGTGLIEGAITDGYLPSPTDASNPWIQLFQKVHDQYDAAAPFDGNVEYGMANAYTLVQAIQAAGKNLTRQGLINAIDNNGARWSGPGIVPFRYSKTQHGGYGGAEIGQLRNGKIVLMGGPLTTDPSPGTPIKPYTTAQAPPPANGIPTN